MERRIKDLEENANLLKKKNDLLETILEKSDREKNELLENLEDKERLIHELKINGNGICENGCHKYNKSMDDVVKAGFKHKGDALAMKEVADSLRKKIYKLKEEKNKLFEEKKQHEEDANDGYDMLQRVRERERILRIQFEENKVQLEKKDTEIKEFLDEKALAERLNGANEKKKNISDKVIKDLQGNNKNLMRQAEENLKVVEMKEDIHHKEVEELLEEIKEIKKINDEKEEQLFSLKNESDQLKVKLKEIEEENLDYASKIAEVRKSEVDGLGVTAKSLEEELEECQLVGKFACKYCDERKGSRSDLKQHIKNVHTNDALLELANMEQKLFYQTQNFTSSVNVVMKREISRLKEPCVCKRFCVTNHLKHNWTRPAADDFVKRFSKIRI